MFWNYNIVTKFELKNCFLDFILYRFNIFCICSFPTNYSFKSVCVYLGHGVYLFVTFSVSDVFLDSDINWTVKPVIMSSASPHIETCRIMWSLFYDGTVSDSVDSYYSTVAVMIATPFDRMCGLLNASQSCYNMKWIYTYSLDADVAAA